MWETAEGIKNGAYKAGKEFVKGLFNFVLHPVKTIESTIDALAHPIETFDFLSTAIRDSYERDVINGDAKSRAEWFSYALGSIGLSVVGTKGLGAVSKTGMATTKVATKAGASKVKGAAQKISGLDLLPYSPRNQLAYANVGVVPYNVVNGAGVKDQLLSMAKMETKGSGKGTGETIQVKNIKDEVDIIAERAKDLDLTLRETPYKIMGSKKMKQLNEKVKNRTITKEEWQQLMWNKRFKRRRDNGVDDFWEQERERLLKGEATRVWTEKQAKDIINGKAPKYEGKTMIGHHTYSTSKYPQISNKGEIIYPVTFREHLYRWHGGSYKKSLPGKPLNDSVDNEF